MKKIMLWVIIVVLSLIGTGSLSAFQQKELVKGRLVIAEAKLGKEVKDKQLVDESTMFSLNERVFFWLKVTGGPADSITVTWKHGDHSYTTKLRIGGSPWRTWANKTAAMAGDWTVTVSDGTGNSRDF